MRWRFCPRSIAVGGICLMAALATGAMSASSRAGAASHGFSPFDPQWAIANPFTRLDSPAPATSQQAYAAKWGPERWGCRSNPAGSPAIISALSSLFRPPNGRTGSRVWGIPRGELQSLAAISRIPAPRSVVFIRRQVSASPASGPIRRHCLAWRTCTLAMMPPGYRPGRPWPAIDTPNQHRRQHGLYPRTGFAVSMIGGALALKRLSQKQAGRTILQPPLAWKVRPDCWLPGRRLPSPVRAAEDLTEANTRSGCPRAFAEPITSFSSCLSSSLS